MNGKAFEILVVIVLLSCILIAIKIINNFVNKIHYAEQENIRFSERPTHLDVQSCDYFHSSIDSDIEFRQIESPPNETKLSQIEKELYGLCEPKKLKKIVDDWYWNLYIIPEDCGLEYCVGIGYKALYYLTNGERCVALGPFAGYRWTDEDNQFSCTIPDANGCGYTEYTTEITNDEFMNIYNVVKRAINNPKHYDVNATIDFCVE